MPAYVVMSACIGVLVWKTIEELYALVRSLHRSYQTKAISKILLIVDLALSDQSDLHGCDHWL